MTKNTEITRHGFTETKKCEIPELSATLRYMEHGKTGAHLLFLDREDKNKTFAIAFPTPPEDDTGVFHIIEHSVLCGSRRYPVKEPFVELLKGSLNTFLNALTYEDRTVYPISSRCDRDFENLMNVYLDAVFHPQMLSDKRIFMQEGGHLEIGEDGTLGYNGVVYNEMKGAYSSPDDLAAATVKSALFPASPYAYDSGGVPEAIRTLTYEHFTEMHRRYYHPSNAYIFLDGSVDLDPTLGIIDSYLSEYSRANISVIYEKHPPLDAGRREIEYEASETEAAEGKSRLLISYVFGDFTRRTEDSAVALLESVLAGSNEAPLKKAMLDTGLVDDLAVYVSKSRENTITFELRGIMRESLAAAEDAFYSAIRKIASDGIDRERLKATLSNAEFKMREGDYGSLPKGVAYALSVFSSWTYGFDPAEHLGYEDVLRELYPLVETDYFEKLLVSMTLDNPYRFILTMHPSATLGDKTREKEESEMQSLLSSLTDTEISEIERDTASLAEWQNTPDSIENLNTLPTLSLDDITSEPETVPTEERYEDGSLVLRHTLPTGGITYATMHFSDGTLTEDEMFYLMLGSLLYKNLPTASHSALSLQSAIKSSCGSLSFSVQTLSELRTPDMARTVLSVSFSCLDSRRDFAVQLVREIISETVFEDSDVLRRILVQLKNASEEAFTSDALSYALSRIGSTATAQGRINEVIGGYEAYIRTRELLEHFDEKKDTVMKEIAALLRRVIKRSNLILTVAGNPSAELESELLSSVPFGDYLPERSVNISPASNEGIAIPSPVGYAALGSISDSARDMLGALRVVRSILSYEYLWNEVRVKGGAYGTGFITRKNGEIAFYSYRDPSPIRSVEIFKKSAAYLRTLANENADLTKFIIGAFGEYDIITTPRTKSSIATRDRLIGWTRDDEIKLRRDMLSLKSSDLLKVADLLDRISESASVCIAAEEQALSAAQGIDRILTV